MNSGRNLLWLVPLILFVTFPLWKIPLGSFLAPPGGYDAQFSQKRKLKHNFIMTGVTIIQSDEEVQTATIRAAEAKTTRRRHEYLLTDVDADIIDDDGVTNVVARTGNYNVLRKRLKLIDDVVVTNRSDNYTMKTELLYYDGVESTVYCPGETQLQGDGITIDGSSFTYDMTKGMYTVGGRVYCNLAGYDGS